MSDYSPEEVRGSSQLSWSDWDELPDRLDVEFPPEKFNLPSTQTPISGHQGQHLEIAGYHNGVPEGAQSHTRSVVGHHANEFATSAAPPVVFTEANQATTEARSLDGNPFGLASHFHTGFNNINAQDFPAERCVDLSLIDPQILGTSTGSPQPRRTRAIRSTVLNTMLPATTSTMRDEIAAMGSFQSTSSHESTSSSSALSSDMRSSYPTPSSNTTAAASPGHPVIQPGSTLLPPAELAAQHPLHQVGEITKSHIPAQTERFLASIEILTMQIRGSMLLLRRQHALGFTIYSHCQVMEQGMRLRVWGEYLNNMRFHCINIRDGLIASLKTLCWSFAEWMGIYKDDLPRGVVLRATGALRQANELKAAIDRFVYPTWEEMVAKDVAREQPINISALTINQLVGDLVDGGAGVISNS
ncbi:hypothetical protein I7I48_07057 [Histoplasma ohiense]|nr:hypothetical protein I7I48_07057 [Histoplasma ohiense (nom. inval.)]